MLFPPLSSRHCEVDKYYLKKEYSFFPSALCGHFPMLTKHPRKPFSQRELSLPTYLIYSLLAVRWNGSSSLLVIQLVPQERIQERIAEQVVVDIPLTQIMKEMLFSSTYASESYRRTDRGRLHSPDSGGNC